MAHDIVAEILLKLAALHPEVPPNEWRRREIEWRREWGGERFYVVKEQGRGKVPFLEESLAAGKTLSEAGRELGVHRTTCWRWIRRGWVSDF